MKTTKDETKKFLVSTKSRRSVGNSLILNKHLLYTSRLFLEPILVDPTLQKRGINPNLYISHIKGIITLYVLFNDMRIAKITMEFAPVCKCINANSAVQVNEMYQFGLIKRTAVISRPAQFCWRTGTNSTVKFWPKCEWHSGNV